MSARSRALRVIEPQMEGVFHAPFNAALLHTVALAYPDAEIVFQAANRHLAEIRQILAEHAPGLDKRLLWEPLRVPPPGPLPARWWSTRQILRSLLATGDRLLFCSISRMQLLVLKQLTRAGDEARCVLHGDLESVEQPQTERFPKSLFALRRVLQQPQPEGLRLVLLSESIRQNLPDSLRRVMGDAGVLDHPYHFPAEPRSVPSNGPAISDGLVLGIFGNTGDARSLEYVARAVKQQRPELRFRLVGFLQDEATVARIADVVEGATAIPISREQFRGYASELTHALWLAEPGGFRLRASGTFFDALAYLKPLIYTANPYLDGYGVSEAGVGTRCESLDAVVTTVLGMAAQAESPDFASEYRTRVKKILRFRERFTPDSLAQELPRAMGWAPELLGKTPR